MLSNYYFLGMGNDTEGYTILSGNNLEKVFVFPYSDTIHASNTVLSVNQLVDKQVYKMFKITIPVPGSEQGTSGYFIQPSAFSSNDIYDVNAMYNSYSKYNGVEQFCITDIFVLSSSINLFKTSNKLIDVAGAQGISELSPIKINFFYDDENYRRANVNNNPRLLVPENLINLSILQSKTQNIHEYLDQFNVSYLNALTGGLVSHWGGYGGRIIGMPISNYGRVLPTSSTIYSFNENSCTSDFFGLSALSINYGAEYYTNDVYVHYNSYGHNYNEFHPALTGNNSFESELNGFTFVQQKYILSGETNKFAALYKNGNKYFPINVYSNKIGDPYRMTLNALGKFEIISGDAGLYIDKTNSFFYEDFGYIYNFGDWLSGLSYTSGVMTNIRCDDFKIEEAPSSQNLPYPNIIGLNKFSEDDDDHYSSKNVLTNIHNIQGSTKFFIAVEPQTYTIAL